MNDNEPVICAGCGAECKQDDIAAGYAITNEGRQVCYECSAKEELRWLQENGRAILYLTGDGKQVGFEITDWPGKLRIKVPFFKRGRHNIAGTRTDVWFRIPDDPFVWHGTQYGMWTQLCHVKRTKQTKF